MSITDRINELKKSRNAVILAHTYQTSDIQDIADYVGDSYGLSVEAAKATADIIIFCGVRFMAETAKVLSPTRTVILPAPDAGCPMADMITAQELRAAKAAHPNHLVMCYVNSGADIKALSDVCCTSSNAVRIANKLPAGRPILFVPDKHLGSVVQEATGREMILWDGFCPTHMRITPDKITAARAEFPNAIFMIHPEARKDCRDLCDQVLSTGQMIDFVKTSSENEFVVATESGIMHALAKDNPEKTFHLLTDTLTCPNMKKTRIEDILAALEGTGGESIEVGDDVIDGARKSLQAMLDLAK